MRFSSGTSPIAEDDELRIVGGSVRPPRASFAAQVVGVLHSQPARFMRAAAGEFRVEPDVGAFGAVEELAIHAQASVGPHVLEEQAFAPARVGHYRVRNETVSLEHG